jgi:hypothetical protein
MDRLDGNGFAGGNPEESRPPGLKRSPVRSMNVVNSIEEKERLYELENKLKNAANVTDKLKSARYERGDKNGLHIHSPPPSQLPLKGSRLSGGSVDVGSGSRVAETQKDCGPSMTQSS